MHCAIAMIPVVCRQRTAKSFPLSSSCCHKYSCATRNRSACSTFCLLFVISFIVVCKHARCTMRTSTAHPPCHPATHDDTTAQRRQPANHPCRNTTATFTLARIPFRFISARSPLASVPLQVGCLPQRVRTEPDRQRFFCCVVGINLHPFRCLMTNNFLRLFSIRRNFPRCICGSLSRSKKTDLEHTIWQPFGGIVSFWEKSPPPKRCLK